MELCTLIRLLFPVNTCHTPFEVTEEILPKNPKGRLEIPKRMFFRKSSKRGGGSFPIQKFILQIFAIINGTWGMNFSENSSVLLAWPIPSREGDACLIVSQTRFSPTRKSCSTGKKTLCEPTQGQDFLSVQLYDSGLKNCWKRNTYLEIKWSQKRSSC